MQSYSDEVEEVGDEVGEAAGEAIGGGTPAYPLRYQRPPPTEYPRLVPEIEPIGGHIRREYEDFQVEEIPLYPCAGDGEHCFVTIVKTNRTTLEAREYLARMLGIPSREIGFAGFKDRRAVARQVFSVPRTHSRGVESIEAPWFKVVGAAYHRNKLRTGHLRGNRFRIRIRDVAPDALPRVRRIIERLQGIGLPNFYGPQRFGHHCDSFQIGHALLHRDPRRVVDYLLAPRGEPEEEYRQLFARQRFEEAVASLPPGRPSEAAMLHALRRYPGNHAAAVRKIPHELKRMYYSAYQGFLFNWCLRERMEWGPESLKYPVAGDLAYLHGRGTCFLVEDIEETRARADAGELSPSGPIFGRKMRLAGGEEGCLEQTILDVEKLRPQSWLSHVKGLHLDGSRRAFRVPLPEVGCTEEPGEAASLVLSFTLPPGGYATVLLEEIMGPGRTRPPHGAPHDDALDDLPESGLEGRTGEREPTAEAAEPEPEPEPSA